MTLRVNVAYSKGTNPTFRREMVSLLPNILNFAE